jgi:pimeloyl-ACP methyl ester carboxylesterase
LSSHFARLGRTPRAAALTVAAVLALAAGGTTAAIAAPSTKPVGAEPVSAEPAVAKPTIVFVHGAWADSNGWDQEITDLVKQGYPVITVATPLRSLTGDADYVRARLATITGSVVLVGHSYGGAVITNAARGAANVKALVYVGAFVPRSGESLATILPPDQYPGSHLDPSKLDVVPVPNADAAGGQDADLYIKPQYFADIFAGDVSSSEAALEAATQRPLSNTAYNQPSGDPAWATVPSWDLITLNDHAISPAGQKMMAARAKAHTENVASSHDVMISHPGAVEKIVLEAACSITS